MQTKYFNDAIIGNKNIVASYNDKGQILRLFYSAPDYKQYLEYMNFGVKVNDSNLIKLHDDINNIYEQSYIEDTNILKTEIINTYFNLQITQTDFVPIKNNILVKKYKFKNRNTIDLNVNFLVHSKLLTDENNSVSGKVVQNGILQYSHDDILCITCTNKNISSHQINDSENNIETGIINDKDYIGMSADSSICYTIGNLKPEEEKSIDIIIYINKNKDKFKLDEIEQDLLKIEKIDLNKELEQTKKYWKKYVKDHTKLELKEETSYERKVKQIYKRTILLYPLLTNEETGGISAAVEIDEQRTQCGRYAYCWPRDAVFVTKAMDLLGMEKETEKFYKNFCKNTQSKSGMWEQRFYTDGRLAPCWGYQIDETASVVFGVYEHYKITKDNKFLKDNLKMCEKAVHFLQKYINQLMNIQEKEDLVKKEIEETYKDRVEKIPVSYDLWEMHEGTHLYSLASIYAAYNSMIKIYDEITLEKDASNNRLKNESIEKNKKIMEEQLEIIKKYVLENLYNEERKSFVRSIEDNKIDISMLGAVVPFNMFSPKEKKILNTVETMNMNIRTYTGGYQRFEQDHYRNGNPWPVATLWMALYYIEIKDYKKAKECFDFVVKSASEYGLLGEQVDNSTMKPAWVIGLGWSHAMFIIVLNKLINRN